MWFPKIGSFLTFSKPLPFHESFPDARPSPVWEGEKELENQQLRLCSPMGLVGPCIYMGLGEGKS